MSVAVRLTAFSPSATGDVDLLAKARRADWRFLLPEPALGRVGYLGVQDPAVVAALQAVGIVAESVDADTTSQGAYDVVVMTDGGVEHARDAKRLLRRGGWLYAETSGRALGSWTRTLRAEGFEDVAQLWLWPRAADCREIVPLIGPAVRHALGRRDPGARLRLRARLAHALAATPLLRFAIRDAAVVGSPR